MTSPAAWRAAAPLTQSPGGAQSSSPPSSSRSGTLMPSAPGPLAANGPQPGYTAIPASNPPRSLLVKRSTNRVLVATIAIDPPNDHPIMATRFLITSFRDRRNLSAPQASAAASPNVG